MKQCKFVSFVVLLICNILGSFKLYAIFYYSCFKLKNSFIKTCILIYYGVNMNVKYFFYPWVFSFKLMQVIIVVEFFKRLRNYLLLIFELPCNCGGQTILLPVNFNIHQAFLVGIILSFMCRFNFIIFYFSNKIVP